MVGLEIQSNLSNDSSDCDEDNDKNGSVMKLVDINVLHCPICFDALSESIFQCEKGHIACSKCCTKMENECPVCDLPIGLSRCRALEKIIKAIIVPCPNAKLGCTQSFSYGQEITHEKKCKFSLCFCIIPDCKYTGSYKDVYKHFDGHEGKFGCSYKLFINEIAEIYVDLRKYLSVVRMKRSDGLRFVAQSFTDEVGVYVTMVYSAPSSSMIVGDFSSHISVVLGTYSMTFEFPKVKKASGLSYETPKEDFMFIPSYITHGHQSLKLKICFTKLNKE